MCDRERVSDWADQLGTFPHRCLTELKGQMNKCISAADVWADSWGPTCRRSTSSLLTLTFQMHQLFGRFLYNGLLGTGLIMPSHCGHEMKLKLYFHGLVATGRKVPCCYCTQRLRPPLSFVEENQVVYYATLQIVPLLLQSNVLSASRHTPQTF